MYIGNRLTGAYGIGVFKLRHTFSNYIIQILECQLFFTHIFHFFNISGTVFQSMRKKLFVNCESRFAENTDHLCLYSKFHSGYRIRTSVRPSGLAVAPAIFRSFATRISFTFSGG